MGDDNPSQNYYTVTDKMGKVVMSGGPYPDKGKTYHQTQCLPCDNYLFTIYDTAGNGICCASGKGGYNLYANNVLLIAGGPFMYSHTTPLTTCAAPISPKPVAPITPTAPVAPVTPTAKPVTPVAPATPVAPKPVTPTVPVTPITPITPVTPKPVPTAPVAPITPVTPKPVPTA